MAELRVYYYNGGDMLKLVRYQKREAEGRLEEENEILSSTQIISSEKNRHKELGKYVESITQYFRTQ